MTEDADSDAAAADKIYQNKKIKLRGIAMPFYRALVMSFLHGTASTSAISYRKEKGI